MAVEATVGRQADAPARALDLWGRREPGLENAVPRAACEAEADPGRARLGYLVAHREATLPAARGRGHVM